MKYRDGIRYLQALILLGICAPVLGQAASTPSQTATPPVLTVEPPVNEPAITPPPVTPPPVTPPPVAPPPIVTPAPAPAPKVVKKKGPVDSLKPGQFVWEQRDSYTGSMKIVAVLDVQRIYVFQDDKLLGFSTISTGKKGNETPTGIFNILQKNVDHKSNLYSNAPMPFMQRLTWDGIAMHAGHLPGYPASHGCIRLPRAFAKALYEATSMGQEVVVLKDASTPVKRPESKPVPVIDPPVAPVTTPPVVDPTIIPPASPPKPMRT